MASVTSSSFSAETTKKELFNNVMKGDWERVVELYQRYPAAHTLKITRSGHTALHVAISDNKEGVVEDLVRPIVAANPGEALKIRNEIGCTPLHFAASMGSPRMCQCIAREDHSLVLERNNKGETPLFWSVLYGQTDAFRCLDFFVFKCSDKERRSCCRRAEDGETILHCAIVGEYYDLAYLIMHRYEELVNSVDVHGFTPLHILATKPSAFKSGSALGRWGEIIYKWIYMDDELKPGEILKDRAESQGDEPETKLMSHPENYRTCFHFIELLAKAVSVVTTIDCAQGGKTSDTEKAQERRGLYPANYATCCEFVKFMYKAILVVVGLGYTRMSKLREEKEKHMWANRVLDRLLETATLYDYEEPGESRGMTDKTEIDEVSAAINTDENLSDEKIPLTPPGGKKGETSKKKKTETALLIAAKNGIVEIVEKILDIFPVAIHDVNQDKKNILLLAVEHRRLQVYKLLLERNIPKGIMFRKVDSQWNSALHFAATLGDHKPWPIPGAALQMQWEIKWYKYIQDSMPPRFFLRTNKAEKTPDEIFTKTHKGLVKSGGIWLTSTSTSCSVVAALIATVAFAASTTVPGGTDQGSGKPTLKSHPAFELFAISSLIALCLSVTSLVMFLSILTSRFQQKDFGKDLPRKLLLGLTSLFVSIAAMLCAFCAGHFFVLEYRLKYAAYPVYVATCLPVSFFAAAQFPLYLDLVKATFWSPF